jgi:PAS domain S-box-containing protein
MELLIVDDSPTDRMVMQAQVQRAFPDVRVSVAGEQLELADSLRRENCDVVITDYWLGWGDGLSVLQRVRRRWPRCKVIFLTGNGGEEVVAQAFQFGLFCYLLKPDGFENLVPAIRTALETKRREDNYELISSVMASIREGIYSLDRSGIVTSFNPAAEHLFGYRATEIIGGDGELLVPAALRADDRRLIGRAMAGEVIAPFETIRLQRDGSAIDVRVSISPLRMDGLSPAGVAIVSRPTAEHPVTGHSSVTAPRIRPRPAVSVRRR